jgi:WD40 repeat protein/serine/threonine protein kinase
MPNASGPNREKEIFERALDIESTEDRQRFLAEACGNDVALLARLQALLSASEAESRFLPDEPSQTPTVLAAAVTEKAGDRIGHYKLLQQIGEGGCGVVYMAEQEEPVRRRVALKVIKPGMDTKQIVARFEAERQALALMEHPNIAKVFDAGETETGRPYFVMELVRGVKITEFCDEAKLTTRERLNLFIEVCQGIQHAHQKGVIHRDIKPSNILVTVNDGVPLPKVIDFGIAKATAGGLTDKTLFTAFEQFMGTPAYMSPEQAVMTSLDIDTRSDIYSLGVLLYELLTGKTPFDATELLKAGLDELRRTIREKEPARPSTRVSALSGEELTTTAKRRGLEAPKLINQLLGDLDWIVMKCLEKDRARRYETANGLARDIERHLSNEPVVARPPSTAYRVQKFVRRNKVIATAAAVVTVALVMGVLISTWQAVRATRESNRAERGERLAKREGERARVAAETLRQSLYVADVDLAFEAWNSGNAGRAREFLDRQRPKNGQADLRTFEWRYLYGITRPKELLTIQGRSGGVWGTAISPNGRILATGGSDGAAQLWDLQSGRELAFLRTDGGPAVYSLTFSPDGRTLVMPNFTTNVYVWDVETQKLKRLLQGHTNSPVVSVAFSPDGKSIASVAGWPYDTDKPGEILVWDAASLQKRAQLVGHRSSVAFVGFSPDSSILAAPMGDGTILLWNIHSGQIVKTLGSHRGLVFSLAFSGDGRRIASGGIDGTVRLWDVDKAQMIALLGVHALPVYSVAFSPDGRRVASASLDYTARLWDVQDGRELSIFKGHSGRVFSVSFSPDGTELVTGSIDGTAKVWRVPPGAESAVFARHTGYEAGVDFSPDGRWLIREAAGGVTLWNSGTLVKVATLPTSGSGFSPDGRLLVCFHESKFELWNLVGTQPERIRQIRTRIDLEGTSPRFSPDGRWMAALSRRNRLTLWRTDEWTEATTIAEGPSPDSDIDKFCFSPDGNLLATSYRSGAIRLWNAKDWSKEALLTSSKQDLHCLAFSPDSRWLASGSGDTAIRLWAVATGEVQHLRGAAGSIWCLAFTHDGKTLAAGSHDGEVRFWNVPTRREVMTLKAHDTLLCSLAFSPDDRILATVCYDQTMRLWTTPSFLETDTAALPQR